MPYKHELIINMFIFISTLILKLKNQILTNNEEFAMKKSGDVGSQLNKIDECLTPSEIAETLNGLSTSYSYTEYIILIIFFSVIVAILIFIATREKSSISIEEIAKLCNQLMDEALLNDPRVAFRFGSIAKNIKYFIETFNHSGLSREEIIVIIIEIIKTSGQGG